MAASRRLRFEILRRDGYTCRYCGSKAPDVTLTVDHVVPVALGGGDEPNNLVTACADCNSGKTSTAPDAQIVEDVDATAMLFARAMQQAIAQRTAELDHIEDLLGQFRRAWFGDGPESATFGMPDDWAATVERFLANGLTIDDLERYVSVAFCSKAAASQVWRYFCGCCWKEIGRRQELARQLIEDGQV